MSHYGNPGRLTRIQWNKCLETLPPCLLLRGDLSASANAKRLPYGRHTRQQSRNGITQNQKWVFGLSKTKLNFESPPSYVTARGTMHGAAWWIHGNTKTKRNSCVCLFVLSFVRLLEYFARNKTKIPKWEPSVTVAETVSCERDHCHKKSGAPLVTVSSKDTCSNCIYLKFHSLIKGYFFPVLLFQKQEVGCWWKENYFCASQSNNQKYFSFIALNLDRFCVLFTIPTHVLLSMCIGVGGCGWPISWRFSLIILVCWVLRNNAPVSASAADQATSLMTVLSAVREWFR